MTATTIFYNSQCSKSRNALALLEENGLKPTIVEYLQNTPSIQELDQICQKLGLEPTEIIRTKEPIFKDLELALSDTRSRESWLQILTENPILIERPIVMHNGKAVVGRSAEKVLGLF